MRASQWDSNLRGRSGKVNLAGGLSAGPRELIIGADGVLDAITFVIGLCKKIVVRA